MNNKYINRFLCFLGFHKWQYLGVSEYQYSTGTFSRRELKQKCYQCSFCGKKNLPWWFDESNRDMHPYSDDFMGEWEEDIKFLKKHE